MTTWNYKIHAKSGIIITQNYAYAEQKSKLGYKVVCKREKNIYRYPNKHIC